MPGLLTRRNYTTWQQEGSTDMARRVGDKVKEIVESHETQPLSASAASALEKIKQQRQKEVGLN
jgi:trimethylamine:corrinoid methyltransferase-like protein